MALKAELESLDGLSEQVAALYKPVERNGKPAYIVDLDGDVPDEYVGPLKRTVGHVKREKQEIEAKYKADLDRMREEHENSLKQFSPKDHVERLEKSWKDKSARDVAEERAKWEPEVQDLNAALRETLVEAKASEMAARLAGDNAHLLSRFIRDRLTVEKAEGKRVTRVLDPEGQPSAMTLADLEKEIRADKRYAQIIVGSKATGGGANGANGPVVVPRADLSKPPPKDPAGLAAWAAAKRAARG